MLLLSLVLLVTSEAGAMEVTRTVSSFTRSRVSLQYRGEDNQTLTEVVEARFAVGAPVLPAVGVLGKPFSSIRACQNVTKLSNEDQEDLGEVILLVKRGNCTFDQKVMNVNSVKNIAGIIVFNDRPDEELKTIFVSNASVPIVFIKSHYGQKFSSLLDDVANVIDVFISAHSSCDTSDDEMTNCINFSVSGDKENSSSRSDLISHWDIVCISVALFLLTSFSLVCFLFYYLRKLRRVAKMDQLSADLEHKARKAVTRLELRKVTLVDRETGTAGDCSVCLEPMMVGAEVRALPCGHAYHRKCVDKWLIRRRKCPLCKLDILQHFRAQLGDSSESES